MENRSVQVQIRDRVGLGVRRPAVLEETARVVPLMSLKDQGTMGTLCSEPRRSGRKMPQSQCPGHPEGLAGQSGQTETGKIFLKVEMWTKSGGGSRERTYF